MRIRTVSTIYMACMAGLALVASGTVCFQSWRQLTQAREAKILIDILEPEVRLIEALALERGVFNQVLVSRDAAGAEAGALIAAQMSHTDALFSRALDQAALLPTDLQSRLSPPLERAFTRLQGARAEADPLRRDPLRAADAAPYIVAQFVDAGKSVDQALQLAQRELTAHDVRLGQMLEVSKLSNDLRELAGRRSTLLSRYAATLERFATKQSVEVSELSGALRITWERLQRVAELIGSPEIDQSIDKVRSEFFEAGDPVYVAMADAARAGAKPPLEFLPWRQWTVTMLGHTLAARDAPIQQGRRDAVLREQEALAAERQALIALVLAMVAVGFVGWFMETRVVIPLANLTQALGALFTPTLKLPEGHDQIATLAELYGKRDHEIGALAKALSRFQSYAAELKRLNQLFHAVLSNMPQGVCFFDRSDRLVVCNDRYSELYNLPPTIIRPGLALADVIAERERAGSKVLHETRSIEHARAGAGNRIVTLATGKIISIDVKDVPGVGWLATHLDITERAQEQARIAHLAAHDALTGLANRTEFHAKLNRSLADLPYGASLAVLCLDLDRFKQINDSLGHACGDEVLRQVGQRLRASLRDEDHIARLGGDEFAIIIADVENEAMLADLAQRLITDISDPYELTDHCVTIGVSIGMALAPQDGKDASSLLNGADLALYRAKADGRGTFRFFEKDMDAKMQQRRLLELDLRQALSNQELELHYQPILNLAQNEICAFEALLRWNHPTRGRISPAEFIPIAEESNLIAEIGAYVLKQACQEAQRWPAAIKVAVNLSPRQFKGSRLLADVTGALAQSGLLAHRLELEITEAVMMDNNEATLASLHQLRSFGVHISMDDFGTGYSSLSYLRRFPFDKIKIDRCFVGDLADDANAISIVRALTSLASGLGMITTAEGVETTEQLERLRAEGCTEIQGFLLSPPVPAADVKTLLERACDLAA